MRRRGRPGWPRRLVGALAGLILFAASSLSIGLIASAGAVASAAVPSLPLPTPSLLPACTPLPGCLLSPTPSVSLPSVCSPLPACLLSPAPTSVSGCQVACGPGGATPPPKGGGSGTSSPPRGGGSSTAGGGVLTVPAGGPPAARAVGTAVGGTSIGIDLPAPPVVALASPGAGLALGKAPFLWPLFLGLDVLAAGVVGLVLRKLWSKPAAD